MILDLLSDWIHMNIYIFMFYCIALFKKVNSELFV